jgi:hypothetical protein
VAHQRPAGNGKDGEQIHAITSAASAGVIAAKSSAASRGWDTKVSAAIFPS